MPELRDVLRYIGGMYDVLVFVYENYWGGEVCPDRDLLSRKLSTAGFERENIQQALAWLDGLHAAARGLLTPPELDRAPGKEMPGMPSAHEKTHEAQEPATAWPSSPDSLRLYTPQELDHLGPDCIACIRFLEDAGALPPELREVVIDRALAIPHAPLDLDDLKIIVLMVYWGVGAEPDVLILDELCDNVSERWMN